MFRDPGVETLLRRELDSLPLPKESEWIPREDRRQTWSVSMWIAAAGALVVLLAFLGPMLADRGTSSSQVAASRTPFALATVVDGRHVAPLPNAHRYPDLGFNLVAPANWRDATRTIAPEPGLLGRVTLTAQTTDRETALLATYGAAAKLPWDVTVEVWTIDQAELQLARFRDACSPSCALGTTVIRGVEHLTSRDPATGRSSFYVARPDRVLVLTYVIGGAHEQPEGVTAETLEQIVRSIGLP